MSESSNLFGKFQYQAPLSRHFKSRDVSIQVLPDVVLYSGRIRDDDEIYFFSFSQLRNSTICIVQVHYPNNRDKAKEFFKDWIQRPINWFSDEPTPDQEQDKVKTFLDDFLDDLLK